MYTIVAFHGSSVGTTETVLAPVPDEHIVYYSDSIRVPELNQLLGLLVFGSSVDHVRLESPSLRAEWLEDVDVFLEGDTLPQVQPVNEGGTSTYRVEPHYAFRDYGGSPLALVAGERLSVKAAARSGTSAITAVLIFGDGVPAPVTGRIRTIKASTSVSGGAGAWATSTLTLGQFLPVGSYDVVGVKVVGANVLAARMLFVGQAWRPGVLAVPTESIMPPAKFAIGNMGVLGTFTNETIPQVELLGYGSYTNPVVYLSIIKR